MIYIKNFLILGIFILLVNCAMSPGMVKSPSKKSQNKRIPSAEYSIDDVKINIINITNLSDEKIKSYNASRVEEINYKVKKFSNIYNYDYEYVLGPADSISINLTDTDDIDNTYLIDQDGQIDVPFVGKINVSGLNLRNAQIALSNKIEQYYKNPDLQLKIEEFNSSKIYVVGAVGKQITINLNQKPINLIDAAIQANFNPSSSSKNFGTKGFLRRDNKVYKIDLYNAFKSLDKKENFYLKKDDVIFIDRNSDAIHVFGEVNKPGLYFPNLDYSITELISTAGLNQITSKTKKIYIIREKLESFFELDIFVLDLRNPINLIAGRKFILQEKDIVYVPPAEIVKWNRTISLLLPQTDLFKSYGPVYYDGFENTYGGS